MVMPYHLHMPSYFLETFTEYPYAGENTIRIISVFISEELQNGRVILLFRC